MNWEERIIRSGGLLSLLSVAVLFWLAVIWAVAYPLIPTEAFWVYRFLQTTLADIPLWLWVLGMFAILGVFAALYEFVLEDVVLR